VETKPKKRPTAIDCLSVYGRFFLVCLVALGLFAFPAPVPSGDAIAAFETLDGRQRQQDVSAQSPAGPAVEPVDVSEFDLEEEEDDDHDEVARRLRQRCVVDQGCTQSCGGHACDAPHRIGNIHTQGARAPPTA